MRLDQWLDRNRRFVVEAFRDIPVVNLPCEGNCGVIVVRSCRKDQVMCGDCDFKQRCRKAAEDARARLAASGFDFSVPTPTPAPRVTRVSRRWPRRGFYRIAA